MPSEYLRDNRNLGGRPSNLTDLLSLPADRFVEEAYLVLRNQLPNEEERQHDVHRLTMGFGRAAILRDIRATADQPEHIQRMVHEIDNRTFIDFLFARYFAHAPSPDMREHFLGLLSDGASRDLVRDLVAKSVDRRLGVGLWVEIEEWLRIQASGKRGIWGWRSRAKRRGRQRNQSLEILCAHRQADDRRMADVVDQLMAGVKQEIEVAILSASRAAVASSRLPASAPQLSGSSLAKVDPAAVLPAARVVLTRLRNLARVAPMEGNV